MADVREIPLELINEPELALRAEISDEGLDELASSIKDIGLQMALIVKPVADGRWEVVDGHRRLLCLRRLRASTALCRVREDAAPDEAIKLACNLQREENTDAEIAVWLATLADKYGWNLEQLCDGVKRGPGWVNDRVGLLRGHQEVFAALAAREINFSQAKELNKIKREDVMRIALHYAQVDGLSADRIREYYRRNEAIMPQPQPEGAEQPASASTEEVVVTPIACEVCGGNRDPVNLETHIMHRWHWLDLLKAMQTGAARNGA